MTQLAELTKKLKELGVEDSTVADIVSKAKVNPQITNAVIAESKKYLDAKSLGIQQDAVDLLGTAAGGVATGSIPGFLLKVGPQFAKFAAKNIYALIEQQTKALSPSEAAAKWKALPQKQREAYAAKSAWNTALAKSWGIVPRDWKPASGALNSKKLTQKDTKLVGMPKQHPMLKSQKKQQNKQKKKVKKLAAKDWKRVDVAPAAYGHITRTGKPRFTSTKGRTIIRHREYVGDLTCEASFTVTRYYINAGLPPSGSGIEKGLFKWLSSVAPAYVWYRLKRMSVEYEMDCGTSTSGTVMIAADYDADSLPPTTKQDFMSLQGASKCAPWEPMKWNANPKQMHSLPGGKKVRDSDLSTGEDYALTDAGSVFVATSGGAGTVSGEIYVSYDVELWEPAPVNMGIAAVGIEWFSGGTVTKNALLGDAPTYVVGAACPCNPTVTYASNKTQITGLKTGSYMARYRMVGTTLTGNGIAAVSNVSIDTADTIVYNTAQTLMWGVCFFSVQGSTASQTGTISVDYSGAATVTDFKLMIMNMGAFGPNDDLASKALPCKVVFSDTPKGDKPCDAVVDADVKATLAAKDARIARLEAMLRELADG